MKTCCKALVIVLLATMPCMLAAQDVASKATSAEPADSVDWQQLIEELISIDDDESNDAWEQQMEQLATLHEEKIDLATATREDLEQLPFLTDEQVEDICEYVYRYGAPMSIGELAMIESIDWRTRRVLKEFVKMQSHPVTPPMYEGSIYKLPSDEQTSQQSKKHTTPLFTKTDEGKGLLLYTFHLPFYQRKGDENGYLGYPYRHTLRYRMNIGPHLRFGLVGAQDAGEPFFTNRNTLGYDHYALYGQLRRLGRLKNLVVGHYRLRLGMGLVMNGNMNLGKRALLDGVTRSVNNITPHSSRMSASYLQGAAATVTLNRQTELTAFASYRKIDATLRGDSAIATRLTSGYHRTPSEMERKNNAAEWLAGLRLAWHYDRWHAGLTALANGFDLPLQPLASTKSATNSQRYREIYPTGRSFGNVAVDYGYRGRRLTLSGETAMDKGGALATLNALTYRPIAPLHLIAVQRFYSYHYQALHAASFGEGSRVQNESGVLVGVRWKPSGNLQMLAYTDYAYFPWARYQASQASHATDHLMELRWNHRQWRFFGRYRLHIVQENDHETDDESNASTTTKSLINHTQHRRRLSAAYDFGRLTTRTQLDAAMSHKHTDSRGWMIGQTLDLRLHRLMMSTHLAYFHSDDYDSRLYSYERNLRYAFSFPAYFGHGLHGALYGSYAIAERLSISAKLSYTHYFDRYSIGSGLQQINHSSQTDAEVQLEWRF